MSFVEMLPGYFEDFGEEITAGTSTFTAIVDVPVTDGLDTLYAAPVLTAIASDIGALAAGDSVAVRSTTYTVRTVEPDGTGLVLIRISKP